MRAGPGAALPHAVRGLLPTAMERPSCEGTAIVLLPSEDFHKPNSSLSLTNLGLLTQPAKNEKEGLEMEVLSAGFYASVSPLPPAAPLFMSPNL